MTNLKDSILRASVGHKRFTQAGNAFSYKVFYTRILVNDKPSKYPNLFSLDAFNILSLKTKMHGKKDGSPWHAWVVAQCQAADIPFDENCSVYFVSHPRLFGYAFNPISYWLIHNSLGELYAVITEVRNTFKNYHNYILAHPDFRAIKSDDIFRAEKKLFVSPFNKIEGYYEFNFEHSSEKFKSVINYYVADELVLNTYMGGEFFPLNNSQIIKTILLYPLMTILVVWRIHLQAVILWYKNVRPTLGSRPQDFENGRTTKADYKKTP